MGFSQRIDSDLCRGIVLYQLKSSTPNRLYYIHLLMMKKIHPPYLKVIEILASYLCWIGREVGDADACGIRCWIHPWIEMISWFSHQIKEELVGKCNQGRALLSLQDGFMDNFNMLMLSYGPLFFVLLKRFFYHLCILCFCYYHFF